MRLPVEFLNKMKALLGDEEYAEFIESYNKPRHYGLRVNTLKIGLEEFLKISPFPLEKVPWTRDGFYYPEGESPGKHPYYHAGLYYIQEPSAMLPGEVIDARPGERILDLCAAPGGKTVQIAAGMKGKGILIANDISSDRVKALVKNIELCGVKNAIVTNDSPAKLAGNFEEYFDKILVDAPCSGEGMFRKDEDAARSWENFKCDICAGMQRDILASVDRMLKPGGYIVYSTCTFAPEENEKMIAEFIDKHKGYELIEIPKRGGIESGRPNWANGDAQLSKAARLWPHKLKGEGHFVAKLRKVGERRQEAAYTQRKAGFMNELETFYSFVKDNLNINIEGYFEVKGNNLYNLPEPPPNLHGIKVAKFGWYLGELARNRFEPSHSMATALKKEDIVNTLDLSSQSSELLKYLKGETLMIEGKKGYTAVCVDGYTLGWGKQTGEMLKNLYPKGWRKMG